MRINNSILRQAMMALIAFCFFQLTVPAQTREETPLSGQTALVGLVRGETIRFTAFNPSETEDGRPNEPISLRLQIFSSHGALITQSPELTIPPGEFRWVDFDHDQLGTPSEPDTSRNQVRTMPLWGLSRSRRVRIPTLLEVLDSNKHASTFRFFLTVEALP
jgi:hypothetical protein